MSQEDINQDLGHYIKEKHKKVPFWKKFKSKLSSKEDIQEDIKHELEAEEKTEDITPEDKEELEEMEDKIVEVNNVQNEVEEELDEKREGLLNRFFKKLNFGKKEHESGYEEDEDDSKEHDEHEESADEISDEEMKQFLKNMHSWITQLSSEKQQEFKESKDFELYTKVLKKHNLIK
jgi:hypothetical protein